MRQQQVTQAIPQACFKLEDTVVNELAEEVDYLRDQDCQLAQHHASRQLTFTLIQFKQA